jgi:predicted transcriptional regulator
MGDSTPQLMTGRKPMTTVRLKLDDADVAELRRIAANEDRSMSGVIRRAVRFYIDHKRKGII